MWVALLLLALSDTVPPMRYAYTVAIPTDLESAYDFVHMRLGRSAAVDCRPHRLSTRCTIVSSETDVCDTLGPDVQCTRVGTALSDDECARVAMNAYERESFFRLCPMWDAVWRPERRRVRRKSTWNAMRPLVIPPPSSPPPLMLHVVENDLRAAANALVSSHEELLHDVARALQRTEERMRRVMSSEAAHTRSEHTRDALVLVFLVATLLAVIVRRRQVPKRAAVDAARRPADGV